MKKKLGVVTGATLVGLVAFSASHESCASNVPSRQWADMALPGSVNGSAQLPDWNIEAEAIPKACERAIEQARLLIQRVAASSPSFESTVLGLERAFHGLEEVTGPILFLKETSTSPEVQDAAAKCQERVSVFLNEVWTRADLFLKVEAVQLAPPKKPEQRKLLEEFARTFARSGAGLPDRQRNEVLSLKQELSRYENQFSLNLAKANDSVALTDAELAGVPEDVRARLPLDSHGKRQVALLDASSYVPVIENATAEATRRKVVTAHERVAVEDNLPLVEKAIMLRTRISQALGFKTHAAWVLDGKMAGKPERVDEFLGDLKTRLKPLIDENFAALRQLKRELDPAASAELHQWDLRYLFNQLRNRKFAVDSDLVREHFPVEHVMTEALAFYERILGVRFHKVRGAKVWAPEVDLYRVTDAATREDIGHFYLDLYPRPNKYKHFAAFEIWRGREGSWPVAAMVGNFPKASPGRPALLSHDDVETLFHEFGHIMHQTLTRAPYASLAGTSVRGDFVEAPSQMLEEFVWRPDFLRRLSKHYATGAALPEPLISAMIRAKNMDAGYHYMRQLFFASIDLKLHSLVDPKKPEDTTVLWRREFEGMFGIRMPEGAAPLASFGHLMGGYDAGYYGYLWSKVFAVDLFTEFERGGLESAEVGKRYRKSILEPGGMREPDELIREFLGRDPNSDAFFRSIGLSVGLSAPSPS